MRTRLTSLYLLAATIVVCVTAVLDEISSWMYDPKSETEAVAASEDIVIFCVPKDKECSFAVHKRNMLSITKLSCKVGRINIGIKTGTDYLIAARYFVRIIERREGEATDKMHFPTEFTKNGWRFPMVSKIIIYPWIGPERPHSQVRELDTGNKQVGTLYVGQHVSALSGCINALPEMSSLYPADHNDKNSDCCEHSGKQCDKKIGNSDVAIIFMRPLVGFIAGIVCTIAGYLIDAIFGHLPIELKQVAQSQREAGGRDLHRLAKATSFSASVSSSSPAFK